MTYDNTTVARMYEETYYTCRGDGTQGAAQAIRRTSFLIHEFYVQHGSLDGTSLKGITLSVRANLEGLFCSQPHEKPRR